MVHFHKVVLGRTLFTLAVTFSIGAIFYVHMIARDYVVFTNPEGPDTSDYFEEE